MNRISYNKKEKNLKTKIVYVLISNEHDTYLEQLYFSMYSLKLYNPNARITIVCDSTTKDSFVDKRKQLSEIADNIVAVDVPTIYTNMQKSRFIKTSLRSYINGDFIYIDNDTIISDDLSDLDNLDSPLMGIPDFHSSLKKYPGNKDFQSFSKKVGLDFDKHKYCFNGGVIYAKDQPISHQFYESWHKEWIENLKLGYSTDQQSLFAANEKCGFPIKVMDDAYNCQIMFNGLKYLYRAKIIHYFASGINSSSNLDQPYIFQNKIHYEYVKLHGMLNSECLFHMNAPKGAFIDNVRISTSFQSAFNTTPFYFMIRDFYYNHPKIIRLMSRLKKLIKR